MSGPLLLLAVFLPLVVAVPALHRRGAAALLVGPVAALLVPWLVPLGTTLSLPWLLLGTQLGLDQTARIFLTAAALVWFGAGLYASSALRADGRAGRFRFLFLLAMAGNFHLVLAQDAVSFYLGFALMGFAAYGLVAHRQSVAARRAARSYLAWTILGEVLLFAALVLLVSGSDGTGFAELHSAPVPDAVIWLLVLGFGIKVALPGLHVWLPLAYPAAPAAGAAVLSGAMINAGLLGWMRFLPLGGTGDPGWGVALVALGLTATFYGAFFGLLQRRPRVVLAYSSISQMGLLTAGIGLALAVPAQAPLLLAAVTLYALHHGLAKASLFLAIDAHARRKAAGVTFVLLVLLSLALAGGPLTSGALAKAAYKEALPADWQWLGGVLVASTLATTLLMARFLVLAWRQRPVTGRIRLAEVAGILIPALAGPALAVLLYSGASLAATSLSASWPLFAGIAVAALLAWRPVPGLQRLPGKVPPGDLPVLVGRCLRHRLPRPRPLPMPAWPDLTALFAVSGRAEPWLRRWPVAGALWLTALIALAFLVSGPRF